MYIFWFWKIQREYQKLKRLVFRWKRLTPKSTSKFKIFLEVQKEKYQFSFFLLHYKYEDFRTQIWFTHVVLPSNTCVIFVEFFKKIGPCNTKKKNQYKLMKGAFYRLNMYSARQNIRFLFMKHKQWKGSLKIRFQCY